MTRSLQRLAVLSIEYQCRSPAGACRVWANRHSRPDSRLAGVEGDIEVHGTTVEPLHRAASRPVMPRARRRRQAAFPGSRVLSISTPPSKTRRYRPGRLP